jgi:hypothetical protein
MLSRVCAPGQAALEGEVALHDQGRVGARLAGGGVGFVEAVAAQGAGGVVRMAGDVADPLVAQAEQVLDHLAGGGAVVHDDAGRQGIGAGRRDQHAAHAMLAQQDLERREVAFGRQQHHLADPALGDEGADAILPAGHVALDQFGRQVAAVLQAGDHQGVVDAGLIAAAGVAHQDADRGRGVRAQASGHGVGLVVERLHGVANPLAGLGGDALVVVQHARDGLRRHARSQRHIVDRRHYLVAPRHK